MTPILPHGWGAAHHGHGTPRLDSDGETLLSGWGDCRIGTHPDRPTAAREAPRRAGAQRWMVRLSDGWACTLGNLRIDRRDACRPAAAPPGRFVGALPEAAR